MTMKNIAIPVHFDEVSEPSTDGDDHSQMRLKTGKKNKAKSSLCKNFSEKGACPYGHKCQFAHGIEELKCNVDENSYKTKPCNSFWKKGHCPYGFRCNFSHSQCEKNNMEPQWERTLESLKSYRDIIYESKNMYRSKLAIIPE